MGPVFWKKVGLSFVRAFVPVFALGVLGVFESVSANGALDLDAGKAALIALITAAITAGIRGAQALFTTLEPTAPSPPA